MENKTKELNILLLGETGVGKTTWINSFANYIKFDSLENAEVQNPPEAIIGANFTITDKETYEQKVIKIGEDKLHENEKFNEGESSTQEPRSYSFQLDDTIIRLIDTPGIGDTRGIEQDAKNFDAILKYLSKLTELHGICILLQPNKARLDIMFQFCVQELLAHLHKSATKNIVFCFTSSRMTHFLPGDTYSALKALLDKENTNISLNKNTVYCMDNEFLAYLCKLHNGIMFDPNQRKQFETSWSHSYQQVHLMLDYFNSIEPHNMKDTMSLNAAKRVIEILSTAVVDISRNIQENISLVEEKKNVVANLKSLDQVDLSVPEIQFVAVQLDKPRVVCTSPQCSTFIQIPGTKRRHAKYTKPCCDKCMLVRVFADRFPNQELKKCKIFDKDTFNCNRCGCSWSTHMHIVYDYVEESKPIFNPSIQDLVKSKKTKQAIEKAIHELVTRISNLKHEQDEITQAGAEFVCFLTNNAIIPYNDAMAEYIDMQMQIEKGKPGGSDKTAMKELDELKQAHNERIALIESKFTGSQRNGNESVNVNNICRLFDKLYALPIKGGNFKKIVDMASETIRVILPEQESKFKAVGKSMKWITCQAQEARKIFAEKFGAIFIN